MTDGEKPDILSTETNSLMKKNAIWRPMEKVSTILYTLLISNDAPMRLKVCHPNILTNLQLSAADISNDTTFRTNTVTSAARRSTQ
jgi:hypothetical protein